jgi:hypothetical protein
VKKNNQGNTAKYNVEDDDYLICKALAKQFDRKYFEKLLVENGLDDAINFDEIFFMNFFQLKDLLTENLSLQNLITTFKSFIIIKKNW